ncbi:MAG: hypothetical protein JNL32_10660 [Candidatus Kapabacteria bacterium]|nr:hypothetical protein [Candidatus Kapabacteria bacterium]
MRFNFKKGVNISQPLFYVVTVIILAIMISLYALIDMWFLQWMLLDEVVRIVGTLFLSLIMIPSGFIKLYQLRYARFEILLFDDKLVATTYAGQRIESSYETVKFVPHITTFRKPFVTTNSSHFIIDKKSIDYYPEWQTIYQLKKADLTKFTDNQHLIDFVKKL